MKGPMKVIEGSSGLMECKVCGTRHYASLQSRSERADGVTRLCGKVPFLSHLGGFMGCCIRGSSRIHSS
jgi:hypothetical protein